MKKIKALLTVFIFFNSFLPLAAESAAHEKFDLSVVLEHHLMDHVAFPFNVGGKKVYEGEAGFDASHHGIFTDHHNEKKYHFVGGMDLHITKRVTMMWIGSLLMMLIMIPAARMIARNPMKIHSRFSGAVEVLVGFIKKDVADQNMHGHGHGYYHYLLSLFFFILTGNLLGIIPPIGEVVHTIQVIVSGSHSTGHDGPVYAKIWNGITTTGDVAVTMSLAILTFIMIYITGFKYQGPKFILDSVPNGVPLVLYPLLWPLEFIISPLAKAFALTVRLLANMTAGHVIILALIGFIFEFNSYYVALISVPGAAMIYLLEIFVAFLQAYIFTLLTALFVGSAMHRH